MDLLFVYSPSMRMGLRRVSKSLLLTLNLRVAPDVSDNG